MVLTNATVEREFSQHVKYGKVSHMVCLYLCVYELAWDFSSATTKHNHLGWILHMHRWSWGMHKYFNPHVTGACDYLLNVGWKLIHVSEKIPSSSRPFIWTKLTREFVQIIQWLLPWRNRGMEHRQLWHWRISPFIRNTWCISIQFIPILSIWSCVIRRCHNRIALLMISWDDQLWLQRVLRRHWSASHPAAWVYF